MPAFFSPQHTDALYPSLREGAARAGRSIEDLEIIVGTGVIVTNDMDAARDTLRPLLGLYLGGMGSRKTNFYQRLAASYGFEDAARRVQDLYLDGHKIQAMAAIPTDLIDAVSIIGPPDVVRGRLEEFEAAGVTTVMVAAIGVDTIEQKVANLRALAEARG
jgi:alkanesulfonate monooxygenase SsuD/methylene tetrahydromethanopterin reductase-like flavin-dependent oxidoreductase (luciferase family)